MSISRRIFHPIESFRTAPVGFCSLLLGAAPIAYDIANDINVYMDTSSRSGIAVIFLGGVAIKKQFTQAERIEASLEKNGHDERFLKPLMSEWCDRQTAKVVYEQAGFENEYTEVVQVERDKGSLNFASVPNI